VYARLVTGLEQSEKDKFDGDLYAPLGPQVSLLQAVERLG
jgi:hypothetical protein